MFDESAAIANLPSLLGHALRTNDSFFFFFKSLSEKQPVSISNFGTFAVYRRKEYKGYNPATKEPITIPATDRVKFRPYAALKKTVSGDE